MAVVSASLCLPLGLHTLTGQAGVGQGLLRLCKDHELVMTLIHRPQPPRTQLAYSPGAMTGGTGTTYTAPCTITVYRVYRDLYLCSMGYLGLALPVLIHPLSPCLQSLQSVYSVQAQLPEDQPTLRL